MSRVVPGLHTKLEVIAAQSIMRFADLLQNIREFRYKFSIDSLTLNIQSVVILKLMLAFCPSKLWTDPAWETDHSHEKSSWNTGLLWSRPSSRVHYRSPKSEVCPIPSQPAFFPAQLPCKQSWSIRSGWYRSQPPDYTSPWELSHDLFDDLIWSVIKLLEAMAEVSQYIWLLVDLLDKTILISHSSHPSIPISLYTEAHSLILWVRRRETHRHEWST